MLFIILIVLVGCQSQKEKSSVQQEIQYAPFNGRWVGEVASSVYPDFMSIEKDSVTSLSIYYRQLNKSVATNFTQEQANISFDVMDGSSKLSISGNLIEKNIFSGFLVDNDKKYTFNLLKVLPNNLADINNFIGFYQIDSGHIIKLTPFLLDEHLTGITILDFKTGKQRVAFPVEEKRYVAGNRMLNPGSREEISFVVTSDSTITFSFFREVKHAKRLPDLTEIQEITAVNKKISLTGSITYPPNNDKKVPLLALIPGSGEAFRGNIADEYVQILPYFGIATFTYDKRGCGESSGDYKSSSFEELAADAIAIIKEVSKQKRIDASKIGIVTLDQAGYLLPIVAKQLPQLRYAVAISPPIVNMKEQELSACANRMKSDGFLQPDINEALDYQEAMFNYLDGKMDSVSFQHLADKIRVKPWKNYVTPFENKEYINFWRINKGFNPQSTWQAYPDIPLLVLYGKSDKILNINNNINLLQTFLPASVKKEIKIIEKANHLLILGANRGDIQLTEIEGYAPETFNTITKWVLDNTH